MRAQVYNRNIFKYLRIIECNPCFFSRFISLKLPQHQVLTFKTLQTQHAIARILICGRDQLPNLQQNKY